MYGYFNEPEERSCGGGGEGAELAGLSYRKEMRDQMYPAGAKAILPPLRKFAVSLQPIKEPRFDEASCIPGEEVSDVITMAIYVPVNTSVYA